MLSHRNDGQRDHHANDVCISPSEIPSGATYFFFLGPIKNHHHCNDNFLDFSQTPQMTITWMFSLCMQVNSTLSVSQNTIASTIFFITWHKGTFHFSSLQFLGPNKGFYNHHTLIVFTSLSSVFLNISTSFLSSNCQ